MIEPEKPARRPGSTAKARKKQLSYNVLRYVNITLTLKQYKSIRNRHLNLKSDLRRGEVLGFDEVTWIHSFCVAKHGEMGVLKETLQLFYNNGIPSFFTI